MTVERMIELLDIEHECILRNMHGECDRDSGKCDLVQDDGELHEMYNDVIAMLKAQIPRVMSFEEVMNESTEVAWTEADCEDDEWAWFFPGIITHKDERFVSSYNCIEFEVDRESYGKEIRCWTSKPTEEQMKAVKWDD